MFKFNEDLPAVIYSNLSSSENISANKNYAKSLTSPSPDPIPNSSGNSNEGFNLFVWIRNYTIISSIIIGIAALAVIVLLTRFIVRKCRPPDKRKVAKESNMMRNSDSNIESDPNAFYFDRHIAHIMSAIERGADTQLHIYKSVASELRANMTKKWIGYDDKHSERFSDKTVDTVKKFVQSNLKENVSLMNVNDFQALAIGLIDLGNYYSYCLKNTYTAEYYYWSMDEIERISNLPTDPRQQTNLHTDLRKQTSLHTDPPQQTTLHYKEQNTSQIIINPTKIVPTDLRKQTSLHTDLHQQTTLHYKGQNTLQIIINPIKIVPTESFEGKNVEALQTLLNELYPQNSVLPSQKQKLLVSYAELIDMNGFTKHNICIQNSLTENAKHIAMNGSTEYNTNEDSIKTHGSTEYNTNEGSIKTHGSTEYNTNEGSIKTQCAYELITNLINLLQSGESAGNTIILFKQEIAKNCSPDPNISIQKK